MYLYVSIEIGLPFLQNWTTSTTKNTVLLVHIGFYFVFCTLLSKPYRQNIKKNCLRRNKNEKITKTKPRCGDQSPTCFPIELVAFDCELVNERSNTEICIMLMLLQSGNKTVCTSPVRGHFSARVAFDTIFIRNK